MKASFEAMDFRFIAFVIPAAFIIGFLSVQMVLAPPHLAPSTDERIHQQRMQNWFLHGYYIPKRFLQDGVPLETLEQGRIHAYGPAWSISAHALNVVRGFETWGEISSKPLPMAMRNHMSVVLGIAAALAVAYAVAVISTSWPAGLWAGAAVLAIPAWTGYSMFHPKDVAVGAGYTMLSAGLALALVRIRYWPIVTTLIAVGIFYGVGTRPAMWFPFAGLLVAFVVLTLWRGEGNRLAIALGAVIGAAAVVTVMPRHVADLHAFVVGTIKVSSSFPVSDSRGTLTFGEMLPATNATARYLAAWFGTAIPLGIMALAVLGAFLLASRAIGDLVHWRRLRVREVGGLFFAAQAFALPLAAAYAGSSIYGAGCGSISMCFLLSPR